MRDFAEGSISAVDLAKITAAVESANNPIDKDLILSELLQSFLGNGEEPLEDVLSTVLAYHEQLETGFGSQKVFRNLSMVEAIYSRILMFYATESKREDFVQSILSAVEPGRESFFTTALPIALAGISPERIAEELEGLPSDAVRQAVDRRLLERWLHGYGRKRALTNYLSGVITIQPTDKLVDQIFSPTSFRANPADMSQIILNAPDGFLRDDAIVRMIRIIADSDPAAARAWLSEIGEPSLAEETRQILTPKSE